MVQKWTGLVHMMDQVCHTLGVQSVQRTLRVFEAVAAHQPIGLSELSRLLDMPKTSVQRALQSLADAQWLRQELLTPGHWVVTAHFAVMAESTPDLLAVREAARPHLAILRDHAEESVGLFVLDGDRMVMAAGMESPHVVRAVEAALGPLPVHVSAAGRAILAHLPLVTRQRILDGVLPCYTEHSVVDPEQVLAEVSKAEAVGYAVVDREYQDDLTVVAAAVRNWSGAPVAALAILAPTHRTDAARVAWLGQLLVATADRLRADLTNQPLDAGRLPTARPGP